MLLLLQQYSQLEPKLRCSFLFFLPMCARRSRAPTQQNDVQKDAAGEAPMPRALPQFARTQLVAPSALALHLQQFLSPQPRRGCARKLKISKSEARSAELRMPIHVRPGSAARAAGSRKEAGAWSATAGLGMLRFRGPQGGRFRVA